MIFSSSIFLFAFLPIILFGYYVVFRNKRNAQNTFLMVYSLLFYAWGEPIFVLAMLGSIIANWALAIWVDRVREQHKMARFAILCMLCFNIGLLFIFKYLMFVVKNINMIFGSNLLSMSNIALPIGISFFTFKAISYVMDVYRKDCIMQKSLLNVALYISFFPQIMAGPIVRYQTFEEQITGRKETVDDISSGVCRFIVGFGKKMLVSNNLALAADTVFAMENRSIFSAWLGVIAYAFQIYYDFSGYSDMALGVGKMFGFHFPENFNYPYISKSISEFWRRWHISLGSWFRDYVYFPLGGSRVSSKWRLAFNLFVVWVLTGLWHGANWTFMIWGLMYFVLITVEKLTGFDQKINRIGHLYTLIFVLIGWVVFRAETLTVAVNYLGNMFGIGAAGLYDVDTVHLMMENFPLYLIATVFSMPIVGYISKKFENNKFASVLYAAAQILILIIAIAFMIKGSYNPFIYFNF